MLANTLPHAHPQLQLLLLTFPAHVRGYGYMLLSVATALLLGIIIYGVAFWVSPLGMASG